MMSGVVLNDEVKWVSFHSGYDFGYFLKVLTCQNLPSDELKFHQILKIYFPIIYDMKYLMRSCRGLRGGLNDIADELLIYRIGPQHQAGSDSLLTLQTFLKMKSDYFDDKIDEKYVGILFGIGPIINSIFDSNEKLEF